MSPVTSLTFNSPEALALLRKSWCAKVNKNFSVFSVSHLFAFLLKKPDKNLHLPIPLFQRLAIRAYKCCHSHGITFYTHSTQVRKITEDWGY